MNTRIIEPLIDKPDTVDIDAIIDDVISHPERAQQLKRALRDQLQRRAPIPARRPHLVSDEPEDDACDLWDNVPV